MPGKSFRSVEWWRPSELTFARSSSRARKEPLFHFGFRNRTDDDQGVMLRVEILFGQCEGHRPW